MLVNYTENQLSANIPVKKRVPVTIILDNVRSALNIGSVFRTCDAFLMEQIFICGISACPPNKEIEKTALGATFSVPWKYFKTTEEAVNEAARLGLQTWAVEQTANSILLNDFKIEGSMAYALVFGNEVTGVDNAIISKCKGAIEIPQLGTKKSLNVAVTAGIVSWEFFKGLKP
jgi:23S rRNA (guanosine2251-2'-O)-methyltransferase